MDDVINRQLVIASFADDLRSGDRQNAEAIQRPLGPNLRDDADRCVGHEDQTEQSILDGSYDQDDHAQAAQQRVESCEQVGTQNCQTRPTARQFDAIALPLLQTPLSLGLVQPLGARRRNVG